MGFAIGILFLIFGGGYYLIRYCIDSGKNAGFKNVVQNDKKNMDDFVDRVCSAKDEEEIRIFKHDNPDKVLKEIEQKAGNEEWYPFLDKDYYFIDRTIYVCRGKLSRFDACHGISCNRIKIIKNTGYIEGREARALYVLWITEQLRKSGINTRIIVKSYDNKYRYLTLDHLYENGDVQYIWEQILSSFVDKNNITNTYPVSKI